MEEWMLIAYLSLKSIWPRTQTYTTTTQTIQTSSLAHHNKNIVEKKNSVIYVPLHAELFKCETIFVCFVYFHSFTNSRMKISSCISKVFHLFSIFSANILFILPLFDASNGDTNFSHSGETTEERPKYGPIFCACIVCNGNTRTYFQCLLWLGVDCPFPICIGRLSFRFSVL